MGEDWLENTIVTRDKTLIHGDYLIDDKPKVGGLIKPKWEHIVFDQPYNRNIDNKLRINWSNYMDALTRISQY